MRGWLWIWLALCLAAPARGQEGLPFRIQTDPPGAEIWQRSIPRDQFLGHADEPITLLPGDPIELIVRMPGFEDVVVRLGEQELKDGFYPLGKGGPGVLRLTPNSLRGWFLRHPAAFIWAALMLVFGSIWLGRRRSLDRRARKLEELVAQAPEGVSWVGRSLGGYLLAGEVGGGGMATVYRGVPLSTMNEEQAVAVKVMHRDFAEEPEFRARFEREIALCRSFNHPNIVRILDWGTADGFVFLIMELLRGKSLRARLPSHPLIPGEAADLLEPLFDALAYAHDLGVVHRDLKPENLILTDQGTLKVLDFGLARRLDSQSHLTRTGTTLGTPAYMAPEQASGGRITAAVDQYALGVIAYEVLTARRPFEGSDPLQVLMQHLSEDPPPPTQFRPDMPPAVERALLRMLAKDPAERYPSLREVPLVAALRAWTTG